MGYGVYEYYGRWQGYMVPAECDMPGCHEVIDRGLSYQCDEHEVYDAHQDEYHSFGGCLLFFCEDHRYDIEAHIKAEPKPDLPQWLWWILVAPSWKVWREENAERVTVYAKSVEESGWRPSKGDMEALFMEMEAESE